MSGLPPQPNPLAYYAWMPPAEASSNEALAVLDACCLAVISYDVVCHFSFDLARLKELRFNRDTFLRGSTWYLLSRWLTFMACLVGTVFEYLRQNGSCSASWTIFSVFYALGNASNSLLLGLRVVAFWNKDKRILWGLGLLWLAVLGMDTSVAWAARGYALAIGDQQVGCVIGDIIMVNGVNINIMGYASTLGYDAICLGLIMYKLWHADGQVVPSFSGREKGSALPVTQPRSTKMITPFLRRQTLITYALSFSASLAFIMVQINPRKELNLIATIAFAVPFETFQNCLICYMFRSLFNFTREQSLPQPGQGVGATPLIGAGGRPGSGDRSSGSGPSSSQGHYTHSTSFDSSSAANHWGTPKFNTVSPSLSQAGGVFPSNGRSGSFSTHFNKRPSFASTTTPAGSAVGYGSQPPTLFSANMAGQAMEHTPRAMTPRSQPFVNSAVEGGDGPVFRITQTEDVEIAPPAGARLAA